MYPASVFLAATFLMMVFAAPPANIKGEHAELVESTDEDFDQILGLSLNIMDPPYIEEVPNSRPTRDIPFDQLQRVRMSLDSVFKDLISCVNETRFDNGQFAALMPALRDRLIILGTEVGQLVPPDARIGHHFAFTQHFFHVLRISNEHMNLLSLVNDRYHRLLYNASELRACVMWMMTAQGTPATEIPQFAQIVARLRNRRFILETEFRNIPNLPLGIRMMIWDHLIRTDEVVQHLQRSIPRHCEL